MLEKGWKKYSDMTLGWTNKRNTFNLHVYVLVYLLPRNLSTCKVKDGDVEPSPIKKTIDYTNKKENWGNIYKRVGIFLAVIPNRAEI